MWLAVRSAAIARASGRLRRPACRHYSAVVASRKSDPLRILFCGSDEFSCAALNALAAEKKLNPGLIESLDVVVRPGKLTGRGMKQIRQGIPIPKDCTLQGLHDILTPIAANMLVDGLRRGLHIPPLKDVGWKPTEGEQEMLCHAPKLAKRDSQIDWSTWSADDIVLRQRVLGSLWSMALADRERKKSMRLILENVESVKRPADVERWIQTYFERQKSGSQHKRGELDEKQAVEENQKLGIKVIDWLWHPKHTSAEDIMNAQDTRLAYFEEKDGSILIPVPKGGCLKVPTIKVEGSSSKSAAKAISSNFGFIEKD
ncbi:hypothetical protein COL26b_009938 [Colletotrichum chrysophilum]|uniref:uncharacterized protein n=1 Tax=Colletotrichum chrysophilum TaxID=1836956 RepID=UPI00230022DF|nr:uncharacterized protein COL26b_009938 [Colletotrichum chrysophilum]KAJ0336973.1 hypothetical protein KNSL1_013084 [Colletotrichum chrysophilum]KAJ0370561.1 hypothetical protein COL26b_009938 [Colletotrichum chrysophilum]